MSILAKPWHAAAAVSGWHLGNHLYQSFCSAASPSLHNTFMHIVSSLIGLAVVDLAITALAKKTAPEQEQKPPGPTGGPN